MQIPSSMKLLYAGMALSMLTSCGGKVHYPDYYVLGLRTPVNPATIGTPVAGSISVKRFSAPAFLRTGSIVYRPSDSQIDFYHYHRWAEDPRIAITDGMIQEIQTRGLFQDVHLFDGSTDSDFLMTGRVERLEEVDQGKQRSVEVSLSAQLLDVKRATVIWRDTSVKTAKVERAGMEQVVSAISEALGSAVRDLVTSMGKQGFENPAIARTRGGQQ